MKVAWFCNLELNHQFLHIAIENNKCEFVLILRIKNSLPIYFKLCLHFPSKTLILVFHMNDISRSILTFVNLHTVKSYLYFVLRLMILVLQWKLAVFIHEWSNRKRNSNTDLLFYTIGGLGRKQKKIARVFLYHVEKIITISAEKKKSPVDTA